MLYFLPPVPRKILSRFMVSGAVFALLVPQIGLAAPPPDPSEQSIPVQLRLIRNTLAEMEARLSTQMSDMEASLESSIGDVQSSVDLGNSKLDYLQGSANEIINILNTVNVDITTELCLDESVMAKLDGGAHGEFGVGWPNVLDAKVALQGDAGFGVDVSVGNELCIQIPLYSVESNEALLNYYDWNTDEFDDLVGDIAGGARAVMPVYAAIFGELMPTPEEAVEALDNYLIAGANFSVLGRNPSMYDPIDLLTPDVLLDPVIPDIYWEFVAMVPDAVDAFVENPCIGLDASPLGPVLKDDPVYNWICGASADVMFAVATAVNTIYGWVEDVFGWVKAIFDWLP